MTRHVTWAAVALAVLGGCKDSTTLGGGGADFRLETKKGNVILKKSI